MSNPQTRQHKMEASEKNLPLRLCNIRGNLYVKGEWRTLKLSEEIKGLIYDQATKQMTKTPTEEFGDHKFLNSVAMECYPLQE